MDWDGQPVMKLSMARFLCVNRKSCMLEKQVMNVAVLLPMVHGSHLSKIIKFQLNKDWILYYKRKLKIRKRKLLKHKIIY